MNSALFSFLVFILCVLILSCIALIVANLIRPKLRPEDLPACETVDFCTQAEQDFYTDIRSVAEKYAVEVFAKVGVGCLVKPKKGVTNRKQWTKELRGEYADFILCDPRQGMRTLLVIMLDDSVLTLAKTRATLVEKACEQAGVPLLYVREYNLPGLEKAVQQKTGLKKPRENQSGAQQQPAPPQAAQPAQEVQAV